MKPGSAMKSAFALVTATALAAGLSLAPASATVPNAPGAMPQYKVLSDKAKPDGAMLAGPQALPAIDQALPGNDQGWHGIDLALAGNSDESRQAFLQGLSKEQLGELKMSCDGVLDLALAPAGVDDFCKSLGTFMTAP